MMDDTLLKISLIKRNYEQIITKKSHPLLNLMFSNKKNYSLSNDTESVSKPSNEPSPTNHRTQFPWSLKHSVFFIHAFLISFVIRRTIGALNYFSN